MKELRIVIADDSEMIRDLVRHTLTQIGGLAIVGEAENGTEAIQLVRELKPDLMVLDLSMPHMGGIEVTKEIRRNNQNTVIIILTADGSPFIEEVCLKGGANFFLNKTEIDELVEICRLELVFKQLPG